MRQSPIETGGPRVGIARGIVSPTTVEEDEAAAPLVFPVAASEPIRRDTSTDNGRSSLCVSDASLSSPSFASAHCSFAGIFSARVSSVTKPASLPRVAAFSISSYQMGSGYIEIRRSLCGPRASEEIRRPLAVERVKTNSVPRASVDS